MTKIRLDQVETTGTFFTDAIDIFGFEQAQNVGLVMIESITAAHDRLPLLRPLQYIKTSLLETGGIDGFAGDDRAAFNISPSVVARPSFVAKNLPPVIEHEIAHVAHRQHNPRFLSEAVTKRDFLLAAAFKEGIARHAEFCLEPSYSAYAYQGHPKMEHRRTQVYAAMEGLDRYRGDAPQGSSYDFLFGRVGLPADGYQIGTYAVTKIIAQHGLGLVELMKAPFADLEVLFDYEAA